MTVEDAKRCGSGCSNTHAQGVANQVIRCGSGRGRGGCDGGGNACENGDGDVAMCVAVGGVAVDVPQDVVPREAMR